MPQVLSTTQTRKLLQAIGCVGPGLCLLYLAAVPQVRPALLKGSLFRALGSLFAKGKQVNVFQNANGLLAVPPVTFGLLQDENYVHQPDVHS